MGKINANLTAFNRGEVSKEALARVDIERLRLSAEEQVNFLPRTLGPMMLRPGMRYVGSTYQDKACLHIPFVFSTTDTALIECTDGAARIIINEVPLSRPTVSTALPGNTSSPAGWTLGTQGFGSAVVEEGYLKLTATGIGAVAYGKQSFTVAAEDIGKEHAIRIQIHSGPVTFRMGTQLMVDDVITQTNLEGGTHSLSFTPTTSGPYYVEFEGRTIAQRWVSFVGIEPGGDVVIPSPWSEASLPLIRYQQSGDVIYVACQGVQQRRIERRAARSWSIVLYQATDGPFKATRSRDFRVWPSTLSGNGYLFAEGSLFTPQHVGTIFRLFTSGYLVSERLSAEDTYTTAIRVTGVGADRTFIWSITDLANGAITIQRSLDSADAGFQDVDTKTADGVYSFVDTLNNSIVWYRMGFKTGAFAGATPLIGIQYGGGGGVGICRITGYVSPTQAHMEVLKTFSSATKTKDWREGEWSDVAGWPSAVALFDGRLWWAGRDRIWASISDSYNSFDIDHSGDAGPISRSIATGPVAIVNWLLPLQRLIIGTEESEVSVRSGAFDEPLTPTNLTLKDCSTQGSARNMPAKIDGKGIFVQKTRRKIFDVSYNVDTQDYGTKDLNQLHPTLNQDDIANISVQRQPDTRIHTVRKDGTAAVLIYDTDESVVAWWRIETDGHIENVVVLPGLVEDRVYYVVRRTINGATKRYLERHTQVQENQGGEINRLADSHVLYIGASTNTITGLSHLEGKTVVLWGNSKDLGTAVVSGGSVTLPEAATTAVVGLGYRARFRSAKLAYAAQLGTALTQPKRINYLGLLMMKTHYQGLRYGQDYEHLDELPLIEHGALTPNDTVWDIYDEPAIELNGNWMSDSRLCLEANAPRPVTVMGAVIGMATHDKA